MMLLAQKQFSPDTKYETYTLNCQVTCRLNRIKSVQTVQIAIPHLLLPLPTL